MLHNERRGSFMFVKLLNGWLSKSIWMVYFIRVRMVENVHRDKDSFFLYPANLLLVFLYLGSQSWLGVKRKAQHPSVEQTQSLTLEEARWTTMAPFSLQRHQRQFGSVSIWLLLWPSIHSWVQSPHLRSVLWSNTEPLENKFCTLPRPAVKWNSIKWQLKKRFKHSSQTLLRNKQQAPLKSW